MTEGWVKGTVEELCKVEYGTRVVRKRDGGSKYPVYGGGGATFAMDTYNREDRVVIARFGMSEHCTRFVEGRFFLNDSGLTLSPRDPSRLLPEFVNIWSFAMNDRIFALGQGAAQKNLDVPAFRALELAYPASLPEQRRIVDTLDGAFEGIAKVHANTEKNIENARAVFESHREDVLAPKAGWQTAPLGDLCSIKHGFAFKGEFFTDAGEFVLLTPGSFFEHGGYRERGEKTKYYVGEIPREYVLKEGDLLTAMTEQAAGLLGSPLIVPESDRFLHNQRLGLFVPKPGKPWVAKFFFHVMNLRRVRKEIHDGGTGAKVRHTSPNRIQAVVVSYPESKKEQQRVATQLDEIESESECLEGLYRRKLAALDELKKSLLHHAFAGER